MNPNYSFSLQLQLKKTEFMWFIPRWMVENPLE